MSLAKRLNETAKELSTFTRSRGESEDREEKIEGILESVCSVVRELAAIDSEEKGALIEKAHQILNEGKFFLYPLIHTESVYQLQELSGAIVKKNRTSILYPLLRTLRARC